VTTSVSEHRWGVTSSFDEDAARLVVRLKEGDPDAFDEIYALYVAPLYGYMVVALRDHYEAEDATQEVFLKALVALPQWEMRGIPFRVWLFRVARNHLLDRLPRLARTEVGDPRAIGRIADEHVTDAEPVEALGRLSDDEFLRVIHSLPRSQRQVLVLRYVFDLSFREIATALGTSSGAARNLQQRAFSALRPRFQARTDAERMRSTA
jgi:RNA polymerase sigma-70 factor (ECF subfamily)